MMSKTIKRHPTCALFAKVETAPAIGGLDLVSPHSKYLLTPEVILFEPTEQEIHRGGAPALPGKPGTRLIFLNTELRDVEQAALAELHAAFEAENGDPTIPEFLRLHAARILQQAKFDVTKAMKTMLTHLEMRVNIMPVAEHAVINELRKGMMYWHGRDRKCRPCLVWRMNRLDNYDIEGATRMMLFLLEYGVRYCLVPGRVENWTLLVDLSGCGMATVGSTARGVAKNVTRLLEEVYCGRNFCTKIFHLPWVLRVIVNSVIPEDKKSKVEFVSDADIQKVMRGLFEPHQIEEQYGGTAPNVPDAEVYPFKFFPHACGPKSGGEPPQESLHEQSDFGFHEGHSWDTFPSAKAKWEEPSGQQALTPAASKQLAKLTAGKVVVQPCQTIERWQELVNLRTGVADEPVPADDILNTGDTLGSSDSLNEAPADEAKKAADCAQADEPKVEQPLADANKNEPLMEAEAHSAPKDPIQAMTDRGSEPLKDLLDAPIAIGPPSYSRSKDIIQDEPPTCQQCSLFRC